MNQTSPFGPIGPPSNPIPNYFSNPNMPAARYLETAGAGAGALSFTTPLGVVKENENEEENEEKEAEKNEQGGGEKDA